MKKSALITAVLLSCTLPVFAYESEEGGYAVNDQKAIATINSQKSFAMVEGDQAHTSLKMVNYFKPEDIQKATEKEFTTEKFNKLYDQLTLLDKAELKLDRLPLEILDLEKYAEAEIPGSLVIFNTPKEDSEQSVKPELRIDKIKDQKTMSYTCYFQDKEQYLGLTSSFLTKNNQLYLVTTVNRLEEAKTKEEKEEPAPGDKLRSYNETPEKAQVKPVEADKVPQSLQAKQWKQQTAFIQALQFKAPVKATKPFGYKDDIYGKQVNLPEDWIYSQFRIDKDKYAQAPGKGVITIASPLSSIRYAANEALQESLGLYEKQDESADQLMEGVMEEGYSKNSENGKKLHTYLEQLDQVLITGSFEMIDKDLAEMLNNPLTLRLETYSLLKAVLDKIKANPTPELKLNDYDLKVNTNDNKALVTLGLDVTALEDINLDGQTKLAAKNDGLMLLVYAKQKDHSTDEILQKALEEWQF